MGRPRQLVHLADDRNRWGACGHARNGVEQTTDPAKVTCGHCRKHLPHSDATAACSAAVNPQHFDGTGGAK